MVNKFNDGSKLVAIHMVYYVNNDHFLNYTDILQINYMPFWYFHVILFHENRIRRIIIWQEQITEIDG